MRVVLRPRHTLQLAGCDQLAHQDAASAFDTLSSVVSELHLFPVEFDAVTEDGEHGTRTHDVGIETFFLQRVVLRQSRFVHQIHGFLHGIADIFVIRCKGEEQVVDFLYSY